MNEKSRQLISRYVTSKIVYLGNLLEIREILLFLDIISHQDYRKLAGLITDIHEIDGLNHVSWGVYRLNDQLSRRIHLNFSFKLNPKFLLSKKVNLNDPEVLDYLFMCIQNEICDNLSKLKTIFDLRLVNDYPELLAVLFSSILDRYRRLNCDHLEFDEAKEIIKKFFSERKISNWVFVKGITEEFFTNQNELKKIFSINYSKQDIQDDVLFFNSLSNESINRKISTAKSSLFTRKGSTSHIPADFYATIITSMVFFICNLLITAAMKFLIPLIPALSSPVALLIIGAVLSIIPVMMTIYLQFYISSRRKKHDVSLKRKLIFNIAEDIPAYQGQLLRSGFNLIEFKKQRFFSPEKLKIKTKSPKKHRNVPSELSPFLAAVPLWT